MERGARGGHAGRARRGRPFGRLPIPGFVITPLLLGLLSATVTSSTASAQEVRVSVLQAWPDHDLLGSPRGVGVAVGVRPFGRLGIRLGGEAYRDGVEAVGSTCMGLVPPDMDCSPEPRDDTARMYALALAFPIAAVARDRLRLDVVPALRTAWLESEQEGLRSGRTRTADKTGYGAEIGVSLEWTPREGWPLGLHAGGHLGVFRGYREELIADGYAPFEDDIAIGRLEVGASYRP